MFLYCLQIYHNYTSNVVEENVEWIYNKQLQIYDDDLVDENDFKEWTLLKWIENTTKDNDLIKRKQPN